MYRIRRSRVFFQSANNSNEEEEKEFEKEGERRKNDSATRRRWFCRCFLAAGKQHII